MCAVTKVTAAPATGSSVVTTRVSHTHSDWPRETGSSFRVARASRLLSPALGPRSTSFPEASLACVHCPLAVSSPHDSPTDTARPAGGLHPSMVLISLSVSVSVFSWPGSLSLSLCLSVHHLPALPTVICISGCPSQRNISLLRRVHQYVITSRKPAPPLAFLFCLLVFVVTAKSETSSSFFLASLQAMNPPSCPHCWLQGRQSVSHLREGE